MLLYQQFVNILVLEFFHVLKIYWWPPNIFLYMDYNYQNLQCLKQREILEIFVDLFKVIVNSLYVNINNIFMENTFSKVKEEMLFYILQISLCLA